jgi:hypothetical protein
MLLLLVVDEIVVVMDGIKYYESKILKVECFSKVWKYFVHYQGKTCPLSPSPTIKLMLIGIVVVLGWKRKWDIW